MCYKWKFRVYGLIDACSVRSSCLQKLSLKLQEKQLFSSSNLTVMGISKFDKLIQRL